MRLLLSDDVMELYLQKRLSLRKDEAISLLTSAVDRESNVILTSKPYLTYMEDVMKRDANLLARWQAFVKELVDSSNGPIKIEKVNTSGDSESIVDEILEIYNSCSHDYLILITSSLSAAKKLPDSFMFSSTIAPHELGWMKLILAARDTVVFQHTDITANADIEKLFDNFFCIKNKVVKDNVFIFTRDCEFYSPTKFRQISKKGIMVKVYSRNFKSSNSHEKISENEHRRLKNIIRATFGTNFEYWVTTDPNLIHERKIVYDKLMMISGDDFGSLDKRRMAWDITIKYSDKAVNGYLAKITKFQRK